MTRVDGVADATLLTLIRSLGYQSKEPLSVELVVSHEGLRFSTDFMHVLQSHLFLPRAAFRAFIPKPEDINVGFTLPLENIVRSFSIGVGSRYSIDFSREVVVLSFGGSFVADSHPLVGKNQVQEHDDTKISVPEVVSLENCDINTNNASLVCLLTTIESSNVAFANLNNDLSLRIVIGASRCRDILGEMAGRDTITISAITGVPMITISAFDTPTGAHYESQVDFTPEGDSLNPTEILSCHRDTYFTYPGKFLAGALADLAVATKASIRIDFSGILCLQVMIPVGLSIAYSEFVVAPIISDD